MQRWPAFFLAFAAALATAQAPAPANGVLLVAKPDLPDPRFAQTVVLVTQTADQQTVGVILNRPTSVRLRDIVDDEALAQNYDQPVFFGGPVLPRTLIALFESRETPEAPAFHVLRDVYLTMHPAAIESLLAQPGARYRLYAGFSGWAPSQLQGELLRDSWYLLPATPELVFRANTEGMWRELLEKARGERAAAPNRRVILLP